MTPQEEREADTRRMVEAIRKWRLENPIPDLPYAPSPWEAEEIIDVREQMSEATLISERRQGNVR